MKKFNATDYFVKEMGYSRGEVKAPLERWLMLASGAKKAVNRELTDEEQRTLAWLCTCEYTTWKNIQNLFLDATLALEREKKGRS